MKTSSSWEAQRDELLALQSIYCKKGECEVIAPLTLSFENLATVSEPNDFASPDYGGIVIRVIVHLDLPAKPATEQELYLSIVFHLGSSYPEEPPGVTQISSAGLPRCLMESVHKRLTTFISSLQPGPCLFEALEWLKEEVKGSIVLDASLLSTPTLAVKEKHSYNESDVVHGKPMVKGHKVTAAKYQTDEASKGACAKQTPLGANKGPHVCIAKLDHMRNEQKYLKLLNSWAKELALYGTILHTGPHFIYVVISELDDCGGASLNEFLKRWRTRNVDVDSLGRPCKERLLTVLYQQQLSGCPGPIEK